MQGRKIERVKDVVAQVMGCLKAKKEHPLLKITGTWQDIAPKNAQKHTRPQSIKNKTLYINVDSSAWLHEMSLLHRQKILEWAQNIAGNKEIQDVRFKIGKI